LFDEKKTLLASLNTTSHDLLTIILVAADFRWTTLYNVAQSSTACSAPYATARWLPIHCKNRTLSLCRRYRATLYVFYWRRWVRYINHGRRNERIGRIALLRNYW